MAQAPEGPATVLFTDVEGSTGLRTRKGDTRAQEILHAHAEIVRREIAHHGGREVKSLGDGFLVEFASPRKAIACAVAIQRGVEEHGRKHPTQRLRLRIGVNAGEVVREDGDVAGEAVNAAARIAARAKGGEVLISEVVRRLAGTIPGIAYLDRGRVALKGFPERWRLYEAREERAAVARPGGPFAGRDAELEALREVLDGAAEGAGRVALIEGEAGIGKTRLLAEALAEAETRRFRLFTGSCDELERERPFGGLAQALDLDPRSPDPERAEIGRLLAGGTSPGASPLPFAQAPELRFRISEAVVALVERLAAEGSVLLAVEDLHWADPSTLLALYQVGRRLADLPLILVGTCRPLPRPPELDRLVESLSSRGGLHLALGPIADDAVTALVSDLVGARPGVSLLRQVATAGGNPLFLTELLGALKEEEAIQVKGGLAEARAVPLPPSLRLTFLRRLSFLPREAVDVLRMASVLGASFLVTDLALVLARAPSDLLPVLEPALRAGVLEESDGRLAFRHDLLREAIHEDVPAAVRSGLHLQAGRALAAAARPASQVATHLAIGAAPGDAEAVEWLRRAAQEAAGKGPGIAVEMLQRALELTPPASPERGPLTFDLALALVFAGRMAEAEGVCRDVLSHAHDPPAGARLRGVLSMILILQGRGPEALQELEALVPESEALGLSKDFLARGYALVSIARMLAGDAEGAEGAGRQAIAAAEASGDPQAVTLAHVSLALALIYRSRVSEARDALDRAVAAADRDETGEALLVQPRLSRGTIILWTDRLREAEESLEAARRDIEDHGGVGWLPVYHTGIATLRYLSGEWDDAVAEFETSLSLADDLGTRMAVVWSHAFLALIAIHRDDLAAAEQSLRAAEREMEARGLTQFSAERAFLARALLDEARGQLDQSLAVLGGAWDLMSGLGYTNALWGLAPDLVRLAIAAGNKQRAETVTKVTEELAAMPDAPGVGAALRCRGLLDDDPDVLLRAVEAYDPKTRRVERAFACEEAALALARGGRVEDAVSLAEEALGTYEHVAALRDLARAEAALRNVGIRRHRRVRRQRATVGWESLTGTELKVVRLAAEGLTNRGIGERLFISPRTVETHLAHVFQKLGLSTRAQLAGEAARRMG